MRTKNCCIPNIYLSTDAVSLGSTSSSLNFERDNRTALLPLRWYRSVSLLILLPQVFEIYGDVGFATYNFWLRFYCPLYLLPISYDDSPHEWLVHVKVSITSVVLLYLSEFRLIQPQDGISVLPLPITRSKELLLYLFSKSTFFNYYRRVFSTFSRIPTHHKS